MVPLPKILWNFSPYFYKYEFPARKSIRRMKQICQEIIKDKHRKSTAAGETARDIKSMLVALVAFRRQERGRLSRVSDPELIENSMVFFIACTDTTTMAIAWASYFVTFCQHIVPNGGHLLRSAGGDRVPIFERPWCKWNRFTVHFQ